MNLVTLCRRHHRAVHEEGYQLSREANGELRFRTPLDQLIEAVPAPPSLSADAVEGLHAENKALGFHIGPHTSMPSWLGDRLDLGYAIDVLHPLANEQRR
jgi:hypothetical protein